MFYKHHSSLIFKPTLQVNVQQRFQELSEILTDQYTEEDRQIVACPRAEQVSFHYCDF